MGLTDTAPALQHVAGGSDGAQLRLLWQSIDIVINTFSDLANRVIQGTVNTVEQIVLPLFEEQADWWGPVRYYLMPFLATAQSLQDSTMAASNEVFKRIAATPVAGNGMGIDPELIVVPPRIVEEGSQENEVDGGAAALEEDVPGWFVCDEATCFDAPGDRWRLGLCTGWRLVRLHVDARARRAT